MWPWTASTEGTVYLFHFERPLGNVANVRAQARHYVGFAEDFERRMAVQLAGKGAKLVAAAMQQGIPYELHHWPACLAVEKLIKRTKKTALYCPTCCTAAGRPPRPLPVVAVQLALPLLLEGDDFPDPLPGRFDWLELRMLRESRAVRAGLIPLAGLDAVDECL